MHAAGMKGPFPYQRFQQGVDDPCARMDAKIGMRRKRSHDFQTVHLALSENSKDEEFFQREGVGGRRRERAAAPFIG
jgi:hypothetical protein